MAARDSDRPRVRVAGLIHVDGRVVLVRHRASSSTYHLLPGGGLEYRETLADAVVREVLEETGLHVEPLDIVLVNDTIDPQGTRHVVNITFTCKVVGGEITDSPQDPRVDGVELVPLDALPQLDLRPPMAEALAGVLSGECPTTHYLGSLFKTA